MKVERGKRGDERLKMKVERGKVKTKVEVEVETKVENLERIANPAALLN